MSIREVLFIYQPLINGRAWVWTAFSLTPKANFLFLLFLISLESRYALSGITLSSLYSICFLFSSLEQWKILPKGETLLPFQIKLIPPSLTSTALWVYLLEKELATPSSIPAWNIPWMEKPGRLQSMGSERVGQNWATSHSFFSGIVHVTFCY